MSQSFLSQLNWRFATKKFDPEKKVSDEDFAKVCDAIRLAPTSSGLQPFHIEVIVDPELRKALYPASRNQAQVLDASHLLIFCARNDIRERTDAYIDLLAEGNQDMKEKLEPKRQGMKKTLCERTPEAQMEWSARQSYVALGFGLAAACELGIDSCAMEGFDTNAVDTILGLPKHLHSVTYLTLGYRTEDPIRAKVRFSEAELFTKR